MEEKTKTLFLVDGEHYPATVLDAVRELEEEEGMLPLGLYFLGGTEKLRDLAELSVSGMELIVPGDPEADFATALRRLRPHVVIDLSDLPVMGPSLRLKMAATALACGAVYRGADFEFRPPRRERILTKPSCSIIGSGKRCGKTAISAEMARYLADAGHRPAVVAMGRGGPPQPYVVEEREINVGYLLSELDKGFHSASDHYEDALMAGVITVGSRRCGGGLAGEPFVTNCGEAARLANALDVKTVIMEGSGSSMPPVATDAVIYVISAAQELEEVLGFLGSYRLLISDGVIITMAEEPFASPPKIQELSGRIKRINGDIKILQAIFRPHPLKSIRGRRVFLVTTAPESAGVLLQDYLEENEGCMLVGRSHSLSERQSLQDELREAVDAEVLLTELKAAAVEVVTRHAHASGKEVVYFHNQPITAGKGTELGAFFSDIWETAMERSCRTKTEKGSRG